MSPRPRRCWRYIHVLPEWYRLPVALGAGAACPARSNDLVRKRKTVPTAMFDFSRMGNGSTDRYDSSNGDLLRQGSGAWIAAVPGRMEIMFTGPKATPTQGTIREVMYPSDIRSAS